MNSSKKIGIVTTSFPRFKGDVAGSFVFDMAKMLLDKGHLVEVVVPQPDIIADWSKNAKWLNSIIVKEAAYIRPRYLQKLFFGAGVLDNLEINPSLIALVPGALTALYAKSMLNISSWDAVVSNWLIPCALTTGYACNFKQIPHLAIAHSGDIHLLGKLPFKQKLAKHISQSASKIGFISNQLKTEFEQIKNECQPNEINSNSTIIPMGVFPETLKSQHSKEQIKKTLGLTKFTILFLGRLVFIKGVDILIDAISKIKTASVQLLVAGDGPQRQKLEQMAKNKNVDALFLGQVNQLQRADVLCACDIIAVPSRTLPNGRHEGLPLTIVEALASNVPLVASLTGAISELVKNEKTALLVEPNNSEALASAILRIINNPTLAKHLISQGSILSKNRNWSIIYRQFEANLKL